MARYSKVCGGCGLHHFYHCCPNCGSDKTKNKARELPLRGRALRDNSLARFAQSSLLLQSLTQEQSYADGVTSIKQQKKGMH